MRRVLGIAVAGGMLLTLVLAAPAAAATTVVDCGAGASLQAAIDAAVPGDTLLIQGTCVGNFTALKVLTLQGQGPKATIVGGSPSTDPVLTATEVTISGLTIRGGLGAGVYGTDGGLLTVNDVTVRDNVGAGILLGGALTMDRSTVSSNGDCGLKTAHFASGYVVDISQSTVRGNGCGIASVDIVTLTDSTVSGNVGVGIANNSGLEGRGYLTVVRSMISANGGGGIYNQHKASVSDSKVMNNTTARYGGGIFNDFGMAFPTAEITISNTKVMNNTAGIDGGGIYNWNDANGYTHNVITLDNVTLRNNTPNNCVGVGC